ncbi:hypothetical protein AB0N18_33765 [Streptomyces griseoincarnatus]
MADHESRAPVDGVGGEGGVRAAVEQAQETAGDPVTPVDGCDKRPDLPAAVEEGGGVGRQQGEEQVHVGRHEGAADGVHHGLVLPECRGLRGCVLPEGLGFRGCVLPEGLGFPGAGPGDDDIRDSGAGGTGRSLRVRQHAPGPADRADAGGQPGQRHGDALPLAVGQRVPPPVARVDGALGVVGAAEHAVGEGDQVPPLVEQVRERGAVVDAVHMRETGQPGRL